MGNPQPDVLVLMLSVYSLRDSDERPRGFKSIVKQVFWH